MWHRFKKWGYTTQDIEDFQNWKSDGCIDPFDVINGVSGMPNAYQFLIKDKHGVFHISSRSYRNGVPIDTYLGCLRITRSVFQNIKLLSQGRYSDVEAYTAEDGNQVVAIYDYRLEDALVFGIRRATLRRLGANPRFASMFADKVGASVEGLNKIALKLTQAVENGFEPYIDGEGHYGYPPVWWAAAQTHFPNLEVPELQEKIGEAEWLYRNISAIKDFEDAVRLLKSRKVSINEVLWLLRRIPALRWFRITVGPRGYVFEKDNIRVGRRSVILAARLSWWIRSAAGEELFGADGKINYGLVKKLQEEFLADRKGFSLRYLTVKQAWTLLYKRVPKGVQQNSQVRPERLDKVSFKTFLRLIKGVPEDEKRATVEPALRISLMFRDIQRAQRWLRITGDTLHDAGQFDIPKSADLSKWRDFLLKYPETRWESGLFDEFEKEHSRLPKGIGEWRKWVQSRTYKGVAAPIPLIKLALEFKLSKGSLKDYVKFFNKSETKSSEAIPQFEWTEGEYKFRKLDYDDPLGPMLGLATNCCQHLHSAGSSCAKQGYKSERAAFFVLEKDGKVVAQSYVWRAKAKGEPLVGNILPGGDSNGLSDVVVFDSIEGLSDAYAEPFAKALQAFKEHISSNYSLGIRKIHVGNTDYGVTERVKRILNGVRTTPVSGCPSSYTDSKEQWRF